MRKLREILKGAAGFLYDFRRFLRHTSTLSLADEWQRDYRVIKVYHALEKALSFREPRPGAGAANAERLVKLLETTDFADGHVSRQRMIGLKVLSDWHDLQGALSSSSGVGKFLAQRAKPLPATPGGSIIVTSQELNRGRLSDPEAFFQSRRSVRDFAAKAVDGALLDRAISLAMASPSVCARHAWHVYHTDERAVIDDALSFQNGNRGFGHEVPLLLVVAADLRAFHAGMERNQHWIDGGMFAMSLVWALHALGISSCCLNWSKGPRGDLSFRRAFRIDEAHSIITMIAVGYPNETIKVCASARRSRSEVHSTLQPRCHVRREEKRTAC